MNDVEVPHGVQQNPRHPQVGLADRPSVNVFDLPLSPLDQLRDFTQGKIYSRDTSYVGRTNEVDAMIKSTKDKKKRWPGLWYELLQGAWDYNDWEKGTPVISIYYTDEESSVSYYQFLQDYSRNGKKRQIDRVEVANHIRKGTGLRPRHVALTEHDEQSGDVQTLGVHGRGLSIATTAALAGNMAEKVTFQSGPSDMGTWYGEAVLVRDEVDPSFPSSLQLRYKHDKEIGVGNTVISVHKPNEDLLEALCELPEWFLPTNPAYRFQRLNTANTVDAKQNELTIFANGKLATHLNDSSFSKYDLSCCNQEGLDKATGIESPRVEILSRDLFRKSPDEIDYVFVDGLRVKVPDARFSQVWAFWGFGKGTRNGYNPKRSNDSLTLNGGIRDLVGISLARCPSKQVFQGILHAASQSEIFFEGNIFPQDFNEIRNFKAAQDALKEAWSDFKRDLKLSDKVYITSNKEAKERADREGKPTIFIHSRAVVDGLVRYVPDLQRVDDVFEREKLEAEQKHREELEKQKREYEAKLEAEKAKSEAAIKDVRESLKKRGGLVSEEAKATGEVVKEAVPDNWKDGVEMMKLDLLHVLGMDDGFIVKEEGEIAGACSFQYRIFEPKERLPSNINQLGNLGLFVRSFSAVFGAYVDIEVKVIKHGKGVYFSFNREEALDDDRNASIHVKRGTIELEGDNFIRIDFIPKDRLIELNQRGAMDSLGSAYHEFLQSLCTDIKSLEGPDGKIDIERYMDSEHAKNYPAVLAKIQLRRQLIEAREEAERELKQINQQRAKYGLPPISLPSGRPEILTPSIDKREDNPFSSAGMTGRVERYITFLSPDDLTGISRSGKADERFIITEKGQIDPESIQARLAAEVNAILNQNFTPDFVLAGNEFANTSAYLVSHINRETADTGLVDYVPLPDLKFEHRESSTSLYIPVKLKSGSVQALCCPPGYEPVSYWHPDGPLPIKISGIAEKRVWAFSVEGQKEVSPGLRIYYRRRLDPDRSGPNMAESRQLADIRDLSPHWQNLILTARESKLSDKQKVDLIIKAWVKAFNYVDTESVFKQFVRTELSEFTTQVINYAEGNCGYSERGLTALLRASGIPCRTKVSFLSNSLGQFNRMKNLHALSEAYIDGRWVLIEPQLGFIEAGYSFESPPGEFKEKFDAILASIPRQRSIATRIIGEITVGQAEKPQTDLPDLFDDDGLNKAVTTIDDAQKHSKRVDLQLLRRSFEAILSDSEGEGFNIDPESLDWVLDNLGSRDDRVTNTQRAALQKMIADADGDSIILTDETLPIIVQVLFEAQHSATMDLSSGKVPMIARREQEIPSLDVLIKKMTESERYLLQRVYKALSTLRNERLVEILLGNRLLRKGAINIGTLNLAFVLGEENG